MSDWYNPDSAATPTAPWYTAFLSQRDVALQVSINFVTRPAVSLTRACFAHNQYEDQAAVRCFSNLLATGFTEFVVDLYWDSSRRVWSLCPVRVPNSTSSGEAPTSVPPVNSTSLASISTTRISDRTADVLFYAGAFMKRAAATTLNVHGTKVRRQDASATESVERASTSSSSIGSTLEMSSHAIANYTATSTSAALPTAYPSTDGTLFQIGPYNCTSSINFPLINNVLVAFLRNTSNTLDASLTYLILNIHAASSTGPDANLSSTILPGPNSLLSAYLDSNLSSYMYTPTQLQRDRVDLNTSWYTGPQSQKPDGVYFTTDIAPDNTYSTRDGWPSESYVEFRKAIRLITSFGDVDAQMSGYNFSGDAAQIFPPYTLQGYRNVSFASAGTITRGCFFDPNITTLTDTNSSWAVSDQSQISDIDEASYSIPVPSISNLTSCGLTYILNETLLDSTADQNISPYQAIAYSSTWSWAAGEPRNVSSSEDENSRLRCAAMGGSLSGRWRVADCSQHNYAACRVGSGPYDWRISSDRASYSMSAEACDATADDTTFAVPRTGLENRYLFSAMQQRFGDDTGDTSIWLNFNSVDEPDCWVAGVNSTCPYVEPSDVERRRTLVVPIVAAVIIFVLAALTVFVKCAANRQNSRRRRRRKGDEGWDYEGVPS